MNVLSLFDGMSCGQIALERAGIDVDLYFASEIDKHAIQVTQKNYPHTIQLGSVTDVKAENLPPIDLLIGGSPCQSFSFAGKRKGMSTKCEIEITSLEQYLDLKEQGFSFEGQSYLFWEYVRVLQDVKPKYFLLENVKMAKKWELILSSAIGVPPIEINSSLVSAQNRKRLFWTNIPGVKQPKDKGILLKDIVHETADFSKEPFGEPVGLTDRNLRHFRDGSQKSLYTTATMYKGAGNNGMTLVMEKLAEYIVPFDKTLQILDKEVERGKVGYFRKDSQANRVYFIHGKAVTLTGCSGGGAAKMGQYLFGCITPDRIEKKQNSQRFNEGEKFYTLTAQDKHGVLVEGYIRKLTPIECERLQTVPENYTEGVSNTQRYKMLGNGWTVDVIAHIFGGLK